MVSILDRVKILDEATPPQHFSELATTFSKKHVKALWSQRFRFYKTTFWHPLEKRPESVFESIITHLRPLAAPSSRVIGVEWWFSVLSTNASPQWILPCHFDRNDLGEKDIDKIVYPEHASVLFFNAVPYGELVVTDQVSTKRGPEPKQPREMVFIEPRANRYAVFPGHLYHGVIGRMWRPRRETVLRIAMAVNWWHEKPKAAYLRESRECTAALGLAL
jgi:hypothetical protein